MMVVSNSSHNSSDAAARLEAATANEQYVLTLYVAGATSRSLAAIENAKAICEERLHGRYRLEIVDIYLNPKAVHDQQIVAVPTLIKTLPPPLRHIVGDLSERDHALVGLGLKPAR